MNQSDFFLSENAVREILYTRPFLGDYGHPFLNFGQLPKYDVDYKKAELIFGQARKSITLPYTELIDFTVQADNTIAVKSLGKYQLPPRLSAITQVSLDAFLAERPRSFNGDVLRLSSLQKNKNRTWECSLESAQYFDQIRTNLSLDFPLPELGMKSLRLHESQNQKQLASFESSILVNSIGVIGVISYYSISRKHRYFFIKERNQQSSVYGNLLSTIGGVMDVPKEPIIDLLKLASAQMEEEFLLETGYSKDDYQLVPLAFCRDLFRGGKPQFFFLIEIPEISEKDFKQGFEQSLEGKIEFQSSLTFGQEPLLSPASLMNYVYALEYYKSKV